MKTFIIRDYPDLDHIFPIINIFLEKNKKVNVLNYEINLNLDEDPRIKYLLKNYKDNINLMDIYKIKGTRIFLDKILNFLASEKYKFVNFKNIKDLKEKNNLLNFYYLFFISFLKKIIFNANSLFENLFFNDIWSENIINQLNITSVVMDDSYFFYYKRPKSLIRVCEKKKIKITLVPHTCYIMTRVEDVNNLKSVSLYNLYPSVIVTSNKIKNFFINCGIESSKIENLGSARFSNYNTTLLEKIYNEGKLENNIKKNNKLNVLYIDGAYDITEKKIKLIHLISKLNNFNFKVKAHPRGLFLFNQTQANEKRFKKNDHSNFSIDISTPTKKLIEQSDIIIGTYSSALIDAILLNKKILFPKFLLPEESKFEIFYENYNFANTFQNMNDTLEFLSTLDKTKLQRPKDKNEVDRFLKDYVYAGKENSDQILNNYFNFLKIN